MPVPIIIAVANHKGGSGKTTTTLSLGCALKKLGYRVLVADLDAQGNLGYSLGINREDAPNLASVLFGEHSVSEAIVYNREVDVLPGGRTMGDVELSLAASQDQKERALLLRNVLRAPELNKYHFILLDSPPSLSLLTINVLASAHKVLIPMALEVLAFQGLDQILGTIEKVKTLYNKELSVLGIVATLYDPRKRITLDLERHLMERYPVPLLNTKIRSSVKLAETPSFARSILSYAPTSSGAKDYLALAEEVLTLLGTRSQS